MRALVCLSDLIRTLIGAIMSLQDATVVNDQWSWHAYIGMIRTRLTVASSKHAENTGLSMQRDLLVVACEYMRLLIVAKMRNFLRVC